MTGALGLDAVIARVAALAAPLGNPRQIGVVADQLVGGRQLGLRVRGQPLRPRRPDPDDRHSAACPLPRAERLAAGTRTSDM